ncbi:MAG: hypothetical protein QFX40_02305 [Archaeoglobales archaeon]|nr:hypothetical protein [Archaeoglobales archaeon]
MVKKKGIKSLIRLIFFAAILIPALSIVSIYLTSKGITLPWVSYIESSGGRTYFVEPLVVIVLSTIMAVFYHLVLQKTDREKYYYYGVVVVIIVIAVAALALYGGACGACATLVCGSGKVQECGIVWRNIIEVKISCVCI